MAGGHGAPPFAMQERIFNTLAELVARCIVLVHLYFLFFPGGYGRLHTLQAGWFQAGIVIMALIGQLLFRTKTGNRAEHH